MKRGSTVFLRLAVVGMSVVVVLLSSFSEIGLYNDWAVEFPHMSYLQYAVMAGVAGVAITFCIAAYQALKLLNYIDKDKIFSAHSIKALGNIKNCAFLVSALFAAAMPIVYSIAQDDDAPGLILVGTFFAAVPFAIAVFLGVTQQLLESVIAMKSENDLTV